MNEWVAYSLKCRKGQAGFALPVAIGMGLIILLVGLTMLLRSQDSQVSAIAQKDTAKSLNAAETGVNEIRALMNQHRAIANHPACTDDLNTPPTRNTNGTCSDSGSTESWALPNNIPSILAECGVDRTGEIISLANREWQNVNSSDSNQGQYRLLTYDAQNSTLRVQGRVNVDQPSESVSELEVKFSVEEVPLAGLWVANDSTVGSINTDIVGSCNSTITAVPQNNHYTKNLSLSIRGIPGVTTSSSLPPRNPSGVIQLNSSESKYLAKYSDTDGLEPPDITKTNFIDIDQNVEIWADGNIDLQNTVIRCGGSSEKCKDFQVNIYGQGSGNILLNKGTVLCNIFFHAPSHDVNNTANFESNPGGNIPTSPNICGTDESGRELFNTSVFWVNSWANSGDVRTPVLDEPVPDMRRKWNDLPFDISYPPQLNPIQSWVTKERSVN